MRIDSSTIGMRGKFKYKSEGIRTINYHKNPVTTLTNNSLLSHTPNGELGIFNAILPVPESAYWLVVRHNL